MRILLVALLVVACTATERPIPELVPWEPPEGQQCDAWGGDFGVEAVLDSAAAVAALRDPGGAEGGLLMSVGVDTTGTVERFRRIQTTLPEERAAAAEAALRGLLRTGGPGRGAGRLLVELDGRGARLSTGPARSCRPAVANEREVRRGLQQIYLVNGRTGQIHAWLRVDTLGRVERAEIRRSSGDRTLDAALFSVARTARFHPALIDGAPIGVWVGLDFVVQADCSELDTLRYGLPLDHPCRPPRRGR